MGEEIKNLEELIQKYTGSNKKVIRSSVKRLTAPGENYIGVVLKVDAVLKNEKDEEENFSAVAKCLNLKVPDFFKKTILKLFIKENGFYTEIAPTLEEFQKEMGLDERGIIGVFPKLYASRNSLDENSTEPDENSVLLFEYLGDKGYVNADRTVGFDVDGAKLILKDLAAFHAITISLKLKKPDVFKDKFMKYLGKAFDPSDFEPPPSDKSDKEKMEDIWVRILEPYKEAKPHLQKLHEKLSKVDELTKANAKRVPKEPFATISHSDLWTNNTMQIFRNKKPIENKIIDLQIYNYDSAAFDVIFFIWGSLQIPTIQQHADSLVKFYHDHFINLLEKCGCDTTRFNYWHFLKEIDEIAKLEFFHLFMMVVPVYGKKEEAVFNFEDEDFDMKEEKVSELARKRAAFLISSFAKRGWF